MTITAVDLFAGSGGWDVAADELDIATLGFENDDDAVATRNAFHFATVPGDLRDADPTLYNAPGLIASPPCQSFSRAGKGAGRARLDDVTFALNAITSGGRIPEFDDVNTALVLEPLHWMLSRYGKNDPFTWVAMEQVPSVLPVWEHYAFVMQERMGYSVFTGIVSAEQYGVPQTRKRAILLARLDKPIRPFPPSHQKYVYGQRQEFDGRLFPWRSIRQALGVDELPVNNQSGTEFDLGWQIRQPAQVVAGRPLIPFRGANANRFNGSTKSRNDGFKVTTEQMSLLQTFPADFPWQGTQTSIAKQIGNAVPPALAKVLLQAVTA